MSKLFLNLYADMFYRQPQTESFPEDRSHLQRGKEKKGEREKEGKKGQVDGLMDRRTGGLASSRLKILNHQRKGDTRGGERPVSAALCLWS